VLGVDVAARAEVVRRGVRERLGDRGVAGLAAAPKCVDLGVDEVEARVRRPDPEPLGDVRRRLVERGDVAGLRRRGGEVVDGGVLASREEEVAGDLRRAARPVRRRGQERVGELVVQALAAERAD
jgi:hypothetical protein